MTNFDQAYAKQPQYNLNSDAYGAKDTTNATGTKDSSAYTRLYESAYDNDRYKPINQNTFTRAATEAALGNIGANSKAADGGPAADYTAAPPDQVATSGGAAPGQISSSDFAKVADNSQHAKTPAKANENSFWGVLRDINDGCVDELTNHMDRVLENVAIGAAIGAVSVVGMAVAPVVTTAALVGAGVLGAVKLVEGTIDLYKNASVVTNSSEYSAQKVAEAHEHLKEYGAGAADALTSGAQMTFVAKAGMAYIPEIAGATKAFASSLSSFAKEAASAPDKFLSIKQNDLSGGTKIAENVESVATSVLPKGASTAEADAAAIASPLAGDKTATLSSAGNEPSVVDKAISIANAGVYGARSAYLSVAEFVAPKLAPAMDKFASNALKIRENLAINFKLQNAQALLSDAKRMESIGYLRNSESGETVAQAIRTSDGTIYAIKAPKVSGGFYRATPLFIRPYSTARFDLPGEYANSRLVWERFDRTEIPKNIVLSDKAVSAFQQIIKNNF